MIKYYYEDKYKTELDTKLTETFEDNNKYFVNIVIVRKGQMYLKQEMI